MAEPHYVESLNEKQREAVLHEGAPLLILAGAGSGKTRVITTKIAYLIGERGVDPRSILAVTFTNKAAGEMRERVAALADGAKEVMIRTFHSFGAWLLRRNAIAAGLAPGFTIYDDEDGLSLLHGLYGDRFKRRELRKYARMVARAKDYGLRPDGDLGAVSADPLFREMFGAYEEKLRSLGNADFGDLISLATKLLREEPGVRDRMRRRFSVILVDEYQDSNIAQFEMLQALTGPDTYLCVVGDDDQSIYRFRGAEVRNILQFSNHFPGTQVIRLEQNYRSTENILKIADAVVRNNTERLGKTLWTDLGQGKTPVVAYLDSADEEAGYVINLLGDGNLDGTAVLYRTNAQSAGFETAFLRHGIPYRVVGSLRFYEREEVKDALALLALFSNPKDEIAFRRVINKPARGIGAVSQERIIALGTQTGGDLFRALELSLERLGAKARKGAEFFLGLQSALGDALATVGLPEFVETLVRKSGLVEHYRKEDEIALTQKVANLEELVSAAKDYPGGEDGLRLFLEDMELDRSRLGNVENDDRGVTLITMHNTKGLEFDRVIITGMDEGLFPSDRGGDVDLEEERRIFYVSITRAKRELHFTTCRTRTIWGRTQQFLPSQFLSEIPEGEIDVLGRVPSAATGEFPPGTKVFQEDYGYGVVYKQVDNGRDLVVMVQFESGRTGQFIPRYQYLEKVRVSGY